MSKMSAYNKNMSQIKMPPVTSRSMMCNKRLVNNVPKLVSMKYAVHPRGYANMLPCQVYSQSQMQTQKHEQFGNPIMAFQSPQILQQERVNMIPLSSTALPS